MIGFNPGLRRRKWLGGRPGTPNPNTKVWLRPLLVFMISSGLIPVIPSMSWTIIIDGESRYKIRPIPGQQLLT